MKPSRNRRSEDVFRRFASKTKFDPETKCWEWTGHKTKEGYGLFDRFDKHEEKWWAQSAHRFSYEIYRGDIPEGLQLDHLCKNTGCVNPSHLEPVTAYENTHRSDSLTAKYALRDRCKHGHVYEEGSHKVHPRFGRVCLVCHRKRCREYMERKRSEAHA